MHRIFQSGCCWSLAMLWYSGAIWCMQVHLLIITSWLILYIKITDIVTYRDAKWIRRNQFPRTWLSWLSKYVINRLLSMFCRRHSSGGEHNAAYGHVGGTLIIVYYVISKFYHYLVGEHRYGTDGTGKRFLQDNSFRKIKICLEYSAPPPPLTPTKSNMQYFNTITGPDLII